MATRTAVVTNKPNTADLADKNKRLAYNMYRGMLTQFYPQANAIIESLPHDRVTYDQGVDRHILDMIQQSNQISGGTKRGSNMSEGAMGGGPGVPPPPPPPPPPMPGPGAPMAARPRPPTSSLEPPAAIQVAMMGQSKDKKPFTYTPGGIDLSQIKSPRMARRICRNAANGESAGHPATAADKRPAAGSAAPADDASSGRGASAAPAASGDAAEQTAASATTDAASDAPVIAAAGASAPATPADAAVAALAAAANATAATSDATGGACRSRSCTASAAPTNPSVSYPSTDAK
ncbi:Hypothetical predicted protein [Cloeon dipterum]|uniref:Uncharacterized protein n=1 Tax=Cloeon dipterum TaxID=197152 RepID=A0A8S1DUX3_9INSE|nr:Hypothetical predicted protein [Cloeon dipterum]